jgi:hypothetical protein
MLRRVLQREIQRYKMFSGLRRFLCLDRDALAGSLEDILVLGIHAFLLGGALTVQEMSRCARCLSGLLPACLCLPYICVLCARAPCGGSMCALPRCFAAPAAQSSAHLWRAAVVSGCLAPCSCLAAWWRGGGGGAWRRVVHLVPCAGPRMSMSVVRVACGRRWWWAVGRGHGGHVVGGEK